MTFAHPLLAVAALLLAVAFVAFASWATRRARGAALAYSQLAFLEGVAGGVPWTALATAAWALALLAGGAALARPSVMATLDVRDATIVLCIDTSGSMSSTDVTPTRAAAAAEAAATFVRGAPDGTRIGLVTFSSSAIPIGAPTDDKTVALDQLARIPPPNGATAIGDALAAAADELPRAGRRAIVLVTDGVNNRGRDPLDAAQVIGAAGIGIFTVGIGTSGSGQLIPGTTEAADLDEDALRAIAASGHGTYARAADAPALRAHLEALAHTSVRERRRVDVTLPLALGGGILALATLFVTTALGRFP